MKFHLAALGALFAWASCAAAQSSLGPSPVLKTSSLGPSPVLKTGSLGPPLIPERKPEIVPVTPPVTAIQPVSLPAHVVTQHLQQTAKPVRTGFETYKLEAALADAKSFPDYQKYPELAAAVADAEALLARTKE